MKNSFNKFISFSIVFVIIFSFSSCMKNDNDSYDGETTESQSLDYKAIYQNFLLEEYDRRTNAEELREDAKFGLLYIDSDSVPELVIANGSYHGAIPELYTIVDNQVKFLGDYGSFGAFQFGEKSGVIESYYFRNGGINRYCFYKLENGVITYLWGGYDQAFPDADYDKPNEYYILETDPYDEDGQDLKYETDKDTFESLLSFYESKIDTDLDGNEAMIEFTPENIDYYFNNY